MGAGQVTEPTTQEGSFRSVSEGTVGIAHSIKNGGPRLWLYTFDPLPDLPPRDLPSWGLLKK